MNKYKTTIKQQFGTEPEYTKWLANNKEAVDQLLEQTDMSVVGEYKAQAEDHTVEGKRIDFSITDDQGKVQAVVESQDANGWLDQNHLYKTLGYMQDKGTDTGIILCENISNNMIEHVEDINENYVGKNVWVVINKLYNINGEVEVDFTPVVKPYEVKPSRRIGKTPAGDFDYTENKALIEELWNNSNNFYTGRSNRNEVTSPKHWYVNKRIGSKVWISADARPSSRPTKFYVGLYARQGEFKVDGAPFVNGSKDEFIKLAKEHGYEANFQQARAYVNIDSTDKVNEFTKALNDAIESGKITIEI
jgi:hypothetical protein